MSAKLPVPTVNLFEVGELHMALVDVRSAAMGSRPCNEAIGGGIAGEAVAGLS
jgi:hypothetical protein